MRISLFVLLTVIPSAAWAQSAPALPDWLVGCWEETVGETRITERWSRSEGALVGTGETFRGGVRAGGEAMRIEPADDGLVFEAVPEGQQRTRFPSSAIGELEVRFDNPAHDFPQRVHYLGTAGGDSLRAVVSMLELPGRSFEFAYRRVTCP